MLFPCQEAPRRSGRGAPSLCAEILEPRLLLSGTAPLPYDAFEPDLVGCSGPAVEMELTAGSAPTGGLMGDTDYSGTVDAFDYMALKRNFGSSSSAGWSEGDLDGDGAVGLSDLNLLRENMGRTEPLLPGLPGVDDFSAGAAAAGSILSTQSGDVLLVLGTDGADVLSLSRADDTITLAVAGLADQTFSGPLFGVAVYGFGGGDEITLAYSLSAGLSVVVYGGGGDDAVYENSQAAAAIHGQNGDDLLVTVGGGADELYGGAGVDGFWFDSADSAGDVEAAETQIAAVHEIAEFTQPTPEAGVSLEIAGQDLPDPAAGVAYNDFSDRPLFVDGPEYDDIIQGSLGDCYYLAGLAALAWQDPQVIEQAITELGDGTYAVRFYRASVEYYYRIDAELPGYPSFTRLTPDGELWASLLEKAFAQHRYGDNSYYSLVGGGVYEAFRALSDAGQQNISCAYMEADAVAQQIADELAQGHAVTAGSKTTASSPIVALHGYMIHSAEQVNGQWEITVYNVWGFDGGGSDGNPSDGLVKLTAEGFKARFSGFTTCKA